MIDLMKRKRVFVSALVISIFIGFIGLAYADTTNTKSEADVIESVPEKTDHAVRAQVSKNYGKLPLSFIRNDGQIDDKVKYYERGRGHSTYFTGEGVYLELTHSEPDNSTDNKAEEINQKPEARDSEVSNRQSKIENRKSSILRLVPLNANKNTEIVAEGMQKGKVNYFVGNDPEKWKTNVATYQSVVYKDVYKDIDMKFYGNNRQMEYDVIVKPGADPSLVRLSYEGIEGLSITEDGKMEINLKEGKVLQEKPYCYQEIDGKRVEIEGSFKLINSELKEQGTKIINRKSQISNQKFAYSFQVASYDKNHSLVIDPVLVYSTYLGGSGVDQGISIAVDVSGNAYITGYTTSTNFPTASPLQASFGGGTGDAFITKIDASGSSLIYSTYLGGSDYDQGYVIAVDATGNVYVSGLTTSSNFPTVSPIQSVYGGGNWDVFVAKIDASGSTLVYSTYLGGDRFDISGAIAVDSSGNAYITGGTGSNNFPTVSPLFGSRAGSRDVFITKIDASGNSLIYSTYLGGSRSDSGYGITVDASGNAYITGYTASTDFPTASPATFPVLQEIFGGGGTSFGQGDGFITKIDASGSSLVYSTYLGGSGDDLGNDIAVDTSGNAYITGHTASTNFPTASPATFPVLQESFGGAGSMGIGDTFITKINASGSSLVYSTYLGGSGDDDSSGIALDASGNVYIAGWTNSSDFQNVFPVQSGYGGAGTYGLGDAFITKIDASGSSLVYSTYLGGSGDDGGFGLAVDATGNIYVSGITDSTDFTTASPYQLNNGGGSFDAFVAKLSPDSDGDGLPDDDEFNIHLTDENDPDSDEDGVYDGFEVNNGTDPNDPASRPDMLLWSKLYGGTSKDFSTDIQLTTDGGYLVVGYTISFGAGDNDIWVLKLNADGTVAWQNTYGGSLKELSTNLLQTADGGSIVVGFTESFGAGGSDAWVLKLNADGTVDWNRTYGGSGNDRADFIQQTPDGGYIVSGITNSFGSGGRDAWVLKLNADGTVDWQKTYGVASSDWGSDIQLASDGGYVVVGLTQNDLWVFKLNSDGTVAWQKRYLDIAVSDGSVVPIIRRTNDGGYIVSVWTGAHATDIDTRLLKLNADGTIAWEKNYGAADHETVFDLQQSADGGYILTGVIFNPVSGDTDAWVFKLNEDSTIDWQKIYDMSGPSGGYSIQQTLDGGYAMAGVVDSSGGSFTDVDYWVSKSDSNGDIGSSCGIVGTSVITSAAASVTVVNTSVTVTDTAIISDATNTIIASPSSLTEDTQCTNDQNGNGIIDINDTASDSDSDGITDSDEIIIYGTDPGNDDTDGDGLSDGDEVNTNGTDPNDPDSDGEGIDDLLDSCPGFDDNLDADGDGAPDDCDICPGFDDSVDADNDGVPDGCDAFPGDPTESSDNDNDGIGDNSDDDFTPTGEDVVVEPVDTNPETTEPTPVTIVFENVTQSGTTTVTSVPIPFPWDPPRDSGFAVASIIGYELESTVEFTDNVEVCFSYGDVGRDGPDSDEENDEEELYKLFHFEDTNDDGVSDTWVNITTTNDYLVNDQICGLVTSFSPFAIFVQDIAAPKVTAELVPVPMTLKQKKGCFTVTISATDDHNDDPELAALLNGYPVTNGQIVELKHSKKFKVKIKGEGSSDDGSSGKGRRRKCNPDVKFKGPSFTLEVTATDYAGNTGAAEPVDFAFSSKHGDGSSDDNKGHGNDKDRHDEDNRGKKKR